LAYHAHSQANAAISIGISVFLFWYITILYFGLSFLFLLIDWLLLRKGAIAKHKIQSSKFKDEALFWRRYKKAFILSAINIVVSLLPTLYVFSYLFTWNGNLLISSWSSYTLQSIAYQALVIMVIEEIGFYYTHRAIHTRLGFKYIHYLHHEYDAPVAVSATASHPLENTFSNLFPMLLGPLVAKSDLLFLLGWVTLAIVNTTLVHSGYNWLNNFAINHDRHHSHLRCAYGVFIVCDWLHGTNYSDLQKQKTKKRS